MTKILYNLHCRKRENKKECLFSDMKTISNIEMFYYYLVLFQFDRNSYLDLQKAVQIADNHPRSLDPDSDDFEEDELRDPTALSVEALQAVPNEH